MNDNTLTLNPLDCRNKILVTKWNADKTIQEQFICDRDDKKAWSGYGVKKQLKFKRKEDQTDVCERAQQVYKKVGKKQYVTKKTKNAIANYQDSDLSAL